MSVLCVLVCKRVYKCVHLLTYLRAVVWLLCVSLSACECVHLGSYACVWVCACMRVVVLVSSFDCLHLSSQLLLFTFLAPFSPSFPPSIPRCLPLHVAPSPVGVDTERPVSALLTLRCWGYYAQTLVVTWALFKYFGNTSLSPLLYHIYSIKMYFGIIQSWKLLQHWLPDTKHRFYTTGWKEGCTVKVWN